MSYDETSTTHSQHMLTSPQATRRWSSVERWQPRLAQGGDGGWREQLDPGTGSSFATVLDLTGEEIVRHIERMRAEYDAAQLVPLTERSRLLARVADLVESAAEDLGEIDARSTGKCHRDGTATARAGAAILRYYAELLSGDPYSTVVPADQPDLKQIVDRVPVGLAACILPWNFPLSQACARLAMLFAAGNSGRR